MSVIFILAALGLTFGYTNPTYRGVTGNTDIAKESIKELVGEKAQYEAALQRTREIEEVRNGLLTKYNLITEFDRANLDKMVPDNIDSVRLVIDVNNIAASYNMSLRDIVISEPPVSTTRKDGSVAIARPTIYSYINLGFSVTGTYSNLVSFLSDLEKDLRLNDIDSLNIGEPDETSSSGAESKATPIAQYKMKVSFKTYFSTSK